MTAEFNTGSGNGVTLIHKCYNYLSILRAVARRRLQATGNTVLEELATQLNGLLNLQKEYLNPVSWRGDALVIALPGMITDDDGRYERQQQMPLLRDLAKLLQDCLEDLGHRVRIDERLNDLEQLKQRLIPA